MKRYLLHILTIILLITSVVLVNNVCADKVADGSGSMEIDELITLLEHPSWRERDKAISHGTRKHLDNRRIQVAVMNQLKKETQLIKDKKVLEDGEGYLEYYINLVDTVTKIDDRRSVPLLVDSLGVVGGNKVPERIAEFGDYGAEHVLKKTNDDDFLVRLDAVFTLNKILEKNSMTKEMRNRIKNNLIRKAQEDKNHFVRAKAVRGLGILADKDIIPIIKKIAREDPYSIKSVKTGEINYRVREEAEKILKEIEDRKK